MNSTISPEEAGIFVFSSRGCVFLVTFKFVIFKIHYISFVATKLCGSIPCPYCSELTWLQGC